MARFLCTTLLHIFLARFLLVLLVFTINAQESSAPTYHSTVSEVRLVFFATDANHHAIASGM